MRQIATVGIGDFGLLAARHLPRAGSVAGLRFSRSFDIMRIRPRGDAWPRFRQTLFVAFWDDERAATSWEENDRFAARLDYLLHLRPVHQRETHPDIGVVAPDAPREQIEGPIAVLTHGTMNNLLNLPRFQRLGAPATLAIHESEHFLGGITGMSLPHRFATFTLWRDQAGLRNVIEGRSGSTAHKDAVRERNRRRFFTHETFIRFTPLSVRGTWDGRDPLADAR